MPLIGINPSRGRQNELSKLEQIVLGLDIAQKVLGTGLAIPEYLQKRKTQKAEEAKTIAETKRLELEASPPDPAAVAELESRGVPKGAIRTVEDLRDWQKRVFEDPGTIEARKYREATLGLAAEAAARAAREEKRKINDANKPKELSQATIQQLEEGRNIPNQLDGLETMLAGVADISGPFEGKFRAKNPYDTRAQKAQAELKAKSQAFGRYMEGGVLRKEDEAKYLKMFPQLSDRPEVQIGKLQIVRDLLKTKQASLVETFKKQGYDMSGFESSGPTSVPGDVDADGVISEAEKWVMDNPDDPRVPDMIKEIKRRRKK